MARPRKHGPLNIFLNSRLVGRLSREPSGAVHFRYAEEWLSKGGVPVSLSLPLREEPYRGAPVRAVFENLLPDSDEIRQRVAEKVGAGGTDAYSLLARIGRDCVGALQFIPGEQEVQFNSHNIEGEELGEAKIEKLLNNLARAPLGLDQDDDFRISVAGAQEKTALLFYKGKWLKPHGTTPTTHLFKPQIGTLPNGIDLSNSVENEFYCLKLLAAFGLPVNRAEIKIFGKTRALVIERFDRFWTKDHGLLRVPMEDFCQALSCPPSLKYQNQGGPGMVDVLDHLKGADFPAQDQKTFLKAQIIFWLIGATDGHAKNFSVFLGPGGTFQLAPLYDVLTAQPSLDSRQIERKQMKLAMSVGNSRHYRVDEIEGRHFVQTVVRAGLPESLARSALQEVVEAAGPAMKSVASILPRGFPRRIHRSVENGIKLRLQRITA